MRKKHQNKWGNKLYGVVGMAACAVFLMKNKQIKQGLKK